MPLTKNHPYSPSKAFRSPPSFCLSPLLNLVILIHSKHLPPFHCSCNLLIHPLFPLNTIPFLQLYSPYCMLVSSLHIHLFCQWLPSSSPSSWNCCTEGKWTNWDLKESNQSSALTKHQRNPDILPPTHRSQNDYKTRHTQTYEQHTSFISSWSKSNVPVSLISRSRTFRQHFKNSDALAYTHTHTLVLT